jgi:hypothetical protein
MKHRLLALSLVFLASCAEEVPEPNRSSFDSTGESREGEKLEKRYKTNAMSGFKQDSEGHWITDTSKRSSLETRGSSEMSGKRFNNKQFSKRDANLPAQWSRTDYAKPEYTGNTDGSALRNPYADASKSAPEAGLFSSLSKKQIATQQITNTSAREARQNSLPTDNRVNATMRRNKLPEPVIIDYLQQRDIDIQQTKAIMGR